MYILFTVNYLMEKFEKIALMFLAHEVSMIRVGLPVLSAVLALQLYALTE